MTVYCILYTDKYRLVYRLFRKKSRKSEIFVKYTGLPKIGTRMCHEFRWKSHFFGHGLFGEKSKVPFFWEFPVSPDFFLIFSEKSLDILIWNPFFQNGSDNRKWKKRLLKKLHLTPQEKSWEGFGTVRGTSWNKNMRKFESQF